jgi:hypothetical protein
MGRWLRKLGLIYIIPCSGRKGRHLLAGKAAQKDVGVSFAGSDVRNMQAARNTNIRAWSVRRERVRGRDAKGRRAGKGTKRP